MDFKEQFTTLRKRLIERDFSRMNERQLEAVLKLLNILAVGIGCIIKIGGAVAYHIYNSVDEHGGFAATCAC